MKIERIDVYVVRFDEHDRFGGQTDKPATLGNSTYYFENDWREVYSTKRMPISASRFSTRGRPPFGRGTVGGNNGAISAHRASGNSFLAIPKPSTRHR